MLQWVRKHCASAVVIWLAFRPGKKTGPWDQAVAASLGFKRLPRFNLAAEDTKQLDKFGISNIETPFLFAVCHRSDVASAAIQQQSSCMSHCERKIGDHTQRQDTHCPSLSRAVL